MGKHNFKLATAYFDAVKSGAKNFEVRRDDRGFQKGDVLVLRRYGFDWLTRKDAYLNAFDRGGVESDAETLHRRITYVLTGGQFGIEPGYVVMGLEPCEDQP